MRDASKTLSNLAQIPKLEISGQLFKTTKVFSGFVLSFALFASILVCSSRTERRSPSGVSKAAVAAGRGCMNSK